MDALIIKLFDKYGSRKALSAVLAIAAVFLLAIPDGLDPKWVAWIMCFKIAGIVLLGVTAIACQWHLDTKDTKPIVDKENGSNHKE